MTENTKDILYIDKIFPTIIGIADCPFIDDVKEEYKSYIAQVKQSNGMLKYFTVHKDKRFSLLNNWITSKVNEYTNLHSFPDTYSPYESWCLEYKKGDFNSSHVHQGSVISVSFYLEGYENDVPISFRGPYFNDMSNPLNLTPNNSQNIINYNEFTYPSQMYYPLTGRLIIFRSYLEHEVGKKINDDNRIVISMNFKKNENPLL